MGYSTSWLASTIERTKFRARFNLRATNEFCDFADFSLSDAILPNGWYLIVANRSDWIEQLDMPALSAEDEVLVAHAEEHVMVSGASLWSGGNEIWCVEHDSQIAQDHLSARGALPSNFAAIEWDMRDRQRDVDDCDYIFDVPVLLAKSICGYRYDEDGPWAEDEEPFERLELARKWWRFWER